MTTDETEDRLVDNQYLAALRRARSYAEAHGTSLTSALQHVVRGMEGGQHRG